MSRVSRATLEVLLLAGTTAAVAARLLSYSPGAAGGLLALTVLSIWHEHGLAGNAAGFGYLAREADTQGTALGALALPWTCAALLAAHLREGSDAGFLPWALHSALAGSAAMLALLAWRVQQPQLTAPHCEPAVTSRPQANGHASCAAHAQSGTGNQAVKRWRTQALAVDATGATSPLPAGTSAAAAAGLQGTHSAVVVPLVLAAACACLPLLGGSSSNPSTSWMGLARATAGTAFAAGIAAAAMEVLLARLSYCFTIGEGMVVAQALSLLALDSSRLLAALATPLSSIPDALRAWPASVLPFLSAPGQPDPSAHLPGANAGRSEVSMFVQLLLFGTLAAAVAAAPVLVAIHRRRRRGASLTSLHCALVGVLLPFALLALRPALWTLHFALATTGTRRALMAYWVAIMAAGLPAMDALARSHRFANILVRKGYHVLALALFLPALRVERDLLAVALAVAAALLGLLEVLRLAHLPLLGERIHAFMTSFTDARDRGVLLVSHFSLLLGMAAPVWLTCSATAHDGNPAMQSSAAGNALHGLAAGDRGTAGSSSGLAEQLMALSGIMVLGIADTAASAVGRSIGRWRICLDSRKTVEGTLGGTVCTLLGWLLLAPLISGSIGSLPWASLVACTAATCLLEAVTTQLDNIFIPLHYLAVLSLT